MGKIAASDYAKIANFVSIYPIEFKKTPNNILFCIKCSESVIHDRRVFVDNHRESMKHRNSSATPNQSFSRLHYHEIVKVRQFVISDPATIIFLQYETQLMGYPSIVWQQQMEEACTKTYNNTHLPICTKNRCPFGT